MLYTIPDYYRQFQCTADRCEDTCCAGWQIVIDNKSLHKYRKVRGKFGRRLRRSIHWRGKTFRQDKEKRCAFLEPDNLCSMYTELGAKGLCRTCRLYPRHVEEFEGVREITLSVSCPEVARILLGKQEPVCFLTYEKEGEEEYEDYNPFLYSKLADGQKEILGILQNRKIELKERIELVLSLAEDMERYVEKDKLFSCDEVFEKYREKCVCAEISETVDRKFCRNPRKVFRKLYTMEFLREDWEPHLRETEDILYGSGRESYKKTQEEFAEWLEIHMPRWQVQCEQLLVYFIATYFCGAVYDGKIYAKARMSVVSVFLIYEMLVARWCKNERQLDFEDVVEIVYRYSREVEHSDKNLELLERIEY